MRRLVVVLIAVMAASAGVALGQGAAPASGKVDVEWKCPAPNPVNMLPVGDKPDHAYVIEQFKCVGTGGEIAGVKHKDGEGTEFVEATGNTSKGHGVFVETLANGDKLTFSYTLTGTSKDKKMVSGNNSWKATSGTGKFKGLTSSGTCTAKGQPDGGIVFTCIGTYALAK